MATAKLNLTAGCGHGTHIEVDGHDITRAVRGITLNADTGNFPALTLELNLLDATTSTDKHTRVLIPSHTRDALVALGWTPPAGNDESPR